MIKGTDWASPHSSAGPLSVLQVLGNRGEMLTNTGRYSVCLFTEWREEGWNGWIDEWMDE